jgi:periplasmic copper chaperone A
MERRSFTASLGFAALLAGLLATGWLAAPLPASSAPPAADVRVENAWIPEPPPGTNVAAAYLTLRNVGRTPAVLIGVSSPVAGSAMVHRSMVRNGESMMMPVERLTIPPGKAVTLEPDGLHVMLNSVRRPLHVGERVLLVLRFAGGEEIHVTAQVRPLGSQ